MARPLEQCTSCGGPLGPHQEYCLECGAHIVRPAGVANSLGVAWRRRLRWYPGDWIWPSLAALLLAAGGAAAAVAAGHGRSATGPETVVALSKLVPAPTQTARPEPTPEPQPASPGKTVPAPKPKPSVISWPDHNGYTIVLASIPIDGGAAEAKQKASEGLAKGLRDVGILVSSRFSSLHPGYYVVFAGVYSSADDAQAALSGVSSKFRQAYPREISR